MENGLGLYFSQSHLLLNFAGLVYCLLTFQFLSKTWNQPVHWGSSSHVTLIGSWVLALLLPRWGGGRAVDSKAVVLRRGFVLQQVSGNVYILLVVTACGCFRHLAG